MNTIGTVLRWRLSNDAIDGRVAQWVCMLAAVGIVPTSVFAVVKHPGTRVDFLFGVGLACLLGLLCAMLSALCRTAAMAKEQPMIRLVPEFASYGVCIATMIAGIRWLPDLDLTPAQVTIGLMLICALALAVLILGMITSLVALKTRKGT
jgi:hypothetical protein